MPSDPASQLLQRRQEALLAKWAAGKRLTPAESEEIADLLPKPTPELRLVAQVEGESQKKYRKGRGEYAVAFGTTARTINRWMEKGAPLDEPARMAAWWAENMKHQVPEELLALAAAPVSPGPATTVPAQGPAPATSDLTPVEQAREVASAAFAELRAAQAATGDPGRLTLAQRSFKDASEQLRRVELATPKIDAASGAVVSREAVRTALTRLHTSMATSLRSFCKRVGRELTGKPAAEQEAIWQAESDKLFSRFRECEFADAA